MVDYYFTDELYHHGVKGMKWGVRKKYQNADGSLTKKGKRVFGKLIEASDNYDKLTKQTTQAGNKEIQYARKKLHKEPYKEDLKDLYAIDKEYKKLNDEKVKLLKERDAAWEEYKKQERIVSHRPNNILTEIGPKRVDEVLNDYKKSKNKR